MPESKKREQRVFEAPVPKSSAPKPNAQWFAPVMVFFLVFGLIWVVAYYLTQAKYPIPDAGNWNLIAGFGFLLFGFGMLTRWR